MKERHGPWSSRACRKLATGLAAWAMSLRGSCLTTPQCYFRERRNAGNLSSKLSGSEAQKPLLQGVPSPKQRFHPLQPDIMLVGDKDGRVKIVNTGRAPCSKPALTSRSMQVSQNSISELAQCQVLMSVELDLRLRCHGMKPELWDGVGQTNPARTRASEVDNCALLGLSWLRHAPNIAAGAPG